MIRALLILAAVFSSFAFAKGKGRAGLAVTDCQGAGQIPNGATLQDAGYRLVLINGQLAKNWSIAIFPTVEEGTVLVKVWEPGTNPRDADGYSEIVKCHDPRPPVVQKPYYYPDTYK